MSGKILIQFFFIVAQTTLKMTSTQKNIAQDIYRLHSQTTQKFPNSHITFSTLLSQNDKLNGKAQDVNKLIIQNCASLNVQLICHSWTLSVPPSRPILHDDKQLNRFAVLLFARVFLSPYTWSEKPTVTRTIIKVTAVTPRQRPFVPYTKNAINEPFHDVTPPRSFIQEQGKRSYSDVLQQQQNNKNFISTIGASVTKLQNLKRK